jgi:3-oxoacyl-[acyl-carrier-protein] synthase II
VPERVVVTGVGAVTPVGLDVPSTWRALLDGRSGVGPVSLFDASDQSVRIAAEVKGFDPARALSAKEVRRTDRVMQFAVAAADEALCHAQSGAPVPPDPDRFGILAASGVGGFTTLSEQWDVLFSRGPRAISPFLLTMFLIDSVPGLLSNRYGARGPNFSIVSACATSAHCLGEAYEIIRRGDADVMLAGGAEAGLTPMGIASFAAIRALSTRNDDPERASRPFDAGRDGMVLGEASGMLLIETLAHAEARGAPILAEMVGYAATADAHHVTAPPEDGEGARRAMQLCLRKAGLSPADVDYISAHATGTPVGDRAETRAVRAVFGAHADEIPISSIKSMTGHLLGAAGAVEAITCVLAIRDGMLPPTINYAVPDPDCDLDYVPNLARARRVDVAISNSFGFGGHNATVAFRRFDG